MEERSRDDDETHELLLLLFLFPLLNVFTLPLRVIEDATSHARTNLVFDFNSIIYRRRPFDLLLFLKFYYLM